MASKPKSLTIALAGNPNSGKTTVFNALTGARQRVGNYPGVTVEKKEGRIEYKGYVITVVDLPGTYSLTAYSIDEIIARNFVIEKKPDVVIDIIDSTNLERNLYLAVQFIELQVPLVLAFNMFDEVKKQGLSIDRKILSELLGVPIVFTIATKKEGLDELLDEAINLFERKDDKHENGLRRTTISYGAEIQEELAKLENILVKDKNLTHKYALRWLAVKLLENDSEVLKRVRESKYCEEILRQLERSSHHLQGIFRDTPEAIIAERRYGFISGACSEAVKKSYEVSHTISDRIDKLLLNRILGLPIFLGLMWLVFKFTFKLSEPLIRLIETGQKFLQDLFSRMLPAGSAIHSLVVDGIIGGVGSVFAFVPTIFLLFLAIAVLEDSGYMARCAFIIDKLMHKIGLHGRSFIPMLLGFGCNLTAIMATRTIEDRKDRLVTILVISFMSCGARLPVYTLFIATFFPPHVAANVLFSIYLLGIAVAIVMAKIFTRFLFKGAAAPFIMELPPYRLPTIKGLLIHMWEKGVVYLKKAGTVIFLGSVFIWFLSNFPWNIQYSKDYDSLIERSQGNESMLAQLENERAAEKLEKSYAGRLGKLIAPIFEPLGFDDWRISVSLIGGFVAKELVISSLGTLHSIGETGARSESLREALRNQTRADGRKLFNPVVAYSLMIFILLYVPCIASLGLIKKETNSWGWPTFATVYTTFVAWMVSFIFYQTARLLGFENIE